MSRAFVKETDGAPEAPLPERPISAAPNRVTARGARLIAQTIALLNEELGRAPDEAAVAGIRRDLRYWHARRASMQVIASPPAPDIVGFGARVTIRRGSTVSDVTIVGEDEADPAAGLIAWTAPLARAVEGAVGDVVELDAGGRSPSLRSRALRRPARSCLRGRG